MKLLIPLMIVFLGSSAWAGGYYSPDFETYDPVTGLYYKAVTITSEPGGILSSKVHRKTFVNLYVFDPATGKSRLVFDEPQTEGIAIVLLETGEEDGVIQFGPAGASEHIQNDVGVAERPLRDKLLIGIRHESGMDLYVSSKMGVGAKKIAFVPPTADWHLDIKNSKLRIVHQTGNGIRLESLDW